MRYRLARLEHRITTPATTGSAQHQAFDTYVLNLFESLAHDRLLPEVLAEVQSPDAAELLRRLAQLMEEAKAAGLARTDATALDLRVVLCGAVLQLSGIAERDPTLWRRYGELVLQALRP